MIARLTKDHILLRPACTDTAVVLSYSDFEMIMIAVSDNEVTTRRCNGETIELDLSEDDYAPRVV